MTELTEAVQADGPVEYIEIDTSDDQDAMTVPDSEQSSEDNDDDHMDIEQPNPTSSTPSSSAPAATTENNTAATTTKSNPKMKLRSGLQRCGKCPPCLNPRWKQKCQSVAAREAELGIPKKKRSTAGKKRKSNDNDDEEKQTSSDSDPPKQQQQQPAKKKPTTTNGVTIVTSTRTTPIPPKQPEDDPFTRSLRSILSTNGGVSQTKYLDRLLDVVKRADTSKRQQAMVQVLAKSHPAVQELFIQHNGLLTIQAWLEAAVTTMKSKVTDKILQCLDALPVTYASLQQPCQLGRMVGKLKKDENMDEEVKERAKELVNSWKLLVVSSRDSEARAVAAAKQKQDELELKKKAAATNIKPITIPKSTIEAATKQKSPKAPTATKEEEDDLFSIADKRRAGAADSLRTAKKAQVIITQHKEPPTTLNRTSSLDPTTTLNNTTAPSKQQQQQTSTIMNPFDALNTPVSRSLANTSLAAGGLSTSSFGSLPAGLPGSGNINSNSTTTPSSSSFGSGLMPLASLISKTPADRAREAAARIPDPTPEEVAARKARVAARNKSVKWVETEPDKVHVAVRWFLRDDAPIKAQHDVDLTKPREEQTPAFMQPPDEPMFASAAKKEHLSEAQALRAHRLEEDLERSNMAERLAKLHAVIEYYDPPLIALPAAVLPPSCGEESTERAAAETRRELEKGTNNGLYMYAEPAEPVALRDRGVFQEIHHLPRIPLSLEQAQQWQAMKWQGGGVGYGAAPAANTAAAAQYNMLPPPSTLPPITTSNLMTTTTTQPSVAATTQAVPNDIGAALASLQGVIDLKSIGVGVQQPAIAQPQPQQPPTALPPAPYYQPQQQQQQQPLAAPARYQVNQPQYPAPAAEPVATTTAVGSHPQTTTTYQHRIPPQHQAAAGTGRGKGRQQQQGRGGGRGGGRGNNNGGRFPGGLRPMLGLHGASKAQQAQQQQKKNDDEGQGGGGNWVV